jgi:hypothetical protein
MSSRQLLVLLLAVTVVAAGGATAQRGSAGLTAAGRCPDFAASKPPPTSISKIQSLQFDLMRRSTFNDFDGPRVVRDLLAHRSLWCGAVMDRLGPDALIKLRDIGMNYWNVDTLYVLSSGKNDAALAALAHRWHADEVVWVGGADASALLGTSERHRILEVWWD